MTTCYEFICEECKKRGGEVQSHASGFSYIDVEYTLLFFNVHQFHCDFRLMCTYNDSIYDYKHQSKEELEKVIQEKEQRRMARGE